MSFCSTIAEICGGVNGSVCPSILIATWSPSATTRYGTIFISSRHFVEAPAHEALDGKHGVLRIGDGLPLGDLPDQPLAGLGKADNGRRQTPALGIGDDDRLPALHDGDDRVGGAQVDPDDLAHDSCSSASLSAKS